MTDPEIHVQLDGEMVPLQECTWLLIAPDGCAAGATVADSGGRHRQPCTTAAAAWDRFNGDLDPAVQANDKAAGFRVELVRMADALPRLHALCTHTPRWGVAPRPQLAGHVWAVKASARKTDRVHLIPEDKATGYAVQLCGAVYVQRWSTRNYDLVQHADCERCLALATAS